MRGREELDRFERLLMPHLGAAYDLARWLTRNDDDARDVVQEAYLRAVKSFERYRGGDARVWLLTIVRNACHTWLERKRGFPAPVGSPSDDPIAEIAGDPALEPEAQVIRAVDRKLLREALDDLPAEFREALVLRELEGLSYKEIADVADVPLGTVMSRLARARERLQRSLLARMKGT